MRVCTPSTSPLYRAMHPCRDCSKKGFADHFVCKWGGLHPPHPPAFLTVHEHRKEQHVITMLAARHCWWIRFFKQSTLPAQGIMSLLFLPRQCHVITQIILFANGWGGLRSHNPHFTRAAKKSTSPIRLRQGMVLQIMLFGNGGLHALNVPGFSAIHACAAKHHVIATLAVKKVILWIVLFANLGEGGGCSPRRPPPLV